ncbi:hypothetical protein N402_06095 [Helicobacter pylori FD423]|nr:hypothetical protein N402_06095 [Helicobacter pylori FD423]
MEALNPLQITTLQGFVKTPSKKQPLKTVLSLILGLVFKIRILNFFITLFLAL